MKRTAKKTAELPNFADTERDGALSDTSGSSTSPIARRSPQKQQSPESPQSPPYAQTPNEKTPASPRTQARINIKETSRAAGRVGHSFWSFVLITACVTLLIPISFLLLPYITRRKDPRCSGGWCGNGTSTTVRPPDPMSVNPVEYEQPSRVSQEEFCRQEVEPDVGGGYDGKLPTTPVFSIGGSKRIALRHLLCHFDTQYGRAKAPYLISLLPTPFCSSLVLSGYAVDAHNAHIIWRPTSGDRYRRDFRTALQTKQIMHDNVEMSLYLTIGGRREDSRNLSLVAENSVTQDRFVRNVKGQINKKNEGVHLDWNYPGGGCSVRGSARDFLQIIEKMHHANLPLVISVPPDESRIQLYHLSYTATLVRFVIVKTHTLVRPDIVTCSGERPTAARIFNKVIEPISMTLRPKFGYSMSVAPETFTAEEDSMWVRSSGPSRWENYTLQLGKTHMAAVCQQAPRYFGTEDECFFTSQTDDNVTFRIATLLTPSAVRERIKRSYDEGMGIAPVMAYDIDLDDFDGSCSNGTHMSPIIEELAVSSY
ncbi:uncharacterized protein [Dermacentor albipictus]|uniref:uncharacterized protein isoform X2 n=1 Tax=Dermacentor albipictus TaxID=60249 RepID=UPI0031FD849D